MKRAIWTPNFGVCLHITVVGEKDGGSMENKEDKHVRATIQKLLGIVHDFDEVGQ